MAKVKGTVTRAGKGKFSYFVQLDGNDFYYNTKFEPPCGEGDVVGIEFEQKGPSRGNIKKIKVLTDNSGGYSSSNSERKQQSSGGGSSSGGDLRQDSIVCQHSQEMAIAAATLLIANDAYAVKGKPDEKRIQIEGLIDELTVKFFKQAENPRADSAFSEQAEIEEDDKFEDDAGDDDGWDDDEWS